jgi:hypothetical protein
MCQIQEGLRFVFASPVLSGLGYIFQPLAEQNLETNTAR